MSKVWDILLPKVQQSSQPCVSLLQDVVCVCFAMKQTWADAGDKLLTLHSTGSQWAVTEWKELQHRTDWGVLESCFSLQPECINILFRYGPLFTCDAPCCSTAPGLKPEVVFWDPSTACTPDPKCQSCVEECLQRDLLFGFLGNQQLHFQVNCSRSVSYKCQLHLYAW